MPGTVVPHRDDTLIACLLARAVETAATKRFAAFPDASTITHEELFDEVRRVAGGLAALGVEPGDRLISWQPNGREALCTWFAANYLGAVVVPLNTAYRGGILEHALNLCGARVAVIHSDLLERLDDVTAGWLHDVVVTGPGPRSVRARCRPWSVISAATPKERAADIGPWDPMVIMYTSGTTGPSKGVVCSYIHISEMARLFEQDITSGDRFLVDMQMFHGAGLLPIYAMLQAGGSVAIREGFRTEGYWDVVRSTEATMAFQLGAVAKFLLKEPQRAEDRDHPLRQVYCLDSAGLRERFGVSTRTFYNMTELSIPIIGDLNSSAGGSCGRVRGGVDVRLVDTHDCPVPDGAAGELIVRTDVPWALNSGYYGMPQETADAWRNGWFHTGDVLRRDEDGNYYYVDRVKDAIRRRGENISSFEVEQEVLAHPSVREAAVVAVPSEFSEDEVLAVVTLVPGVSVELADLFAFLRPRLPHFMLPRYLRIVDELPKTPTEKVRKHLLRDTGITAETWDREAAGIVVKRDQFIATQGGSR